MKTPGTEPARRTVAKPEIAHARLQLLGPIQILLQGRAVSLTITKAQALLTYLALTATPVARVRLMDLLWPESHPDAARKNLRNTLWQIRRRLGDEFLIADDERVELSPSVVVDVVEFEARLTTAPGVAAASDEALQAALELWRGTLAQDLSPGDAPDFELWLEAERRRLGDLYTQGITQLVDRLRRTARWSALIDVGQRALRQDPTVEPIHVALMEAYARLGRRDAALRQFEALDNTLEEELGAAPLTTSRTLYEQIRNGTLPGMLPGDRSDAPPPTGAAAVPARGTAYGRPFVGRQAERQTLDDALRVAGEGRLQIVLISGELGLGKSYLWRRWANDLPPSAVMLETRCLDTTQTLPFAPLTGFFASQWSVERLFGPDAPVSPLWLVELARLLPQIRDHHPDLPAAAPLPPEEERRRIFEAFVQTLRALNARPLILFIDDLHWADRATLDWLIYLADRMRSEPLLLVSAYRPDEASPALKLFATGWSREGEVRRLPLAPLTAREAAELIAALDGDAAAADRLYTRSGGNPYFLTELSRAYPGGTPDALADLIRARLHSLPEEAQRLLQLAAILEPTISFDMLQALSQQTETATLDALDTLLTRTILVEHGDAYEFAHPLLADLVRDELSTPRRRSLHLRVADHLHALYGEAPDAVVGRLAYHYAEAGQPARSAHFAESAAAQAVQVGAMAEAVNFYRRAHDLEPTPMRLLELGHALMHVPGRTEDARAAMQAALVEFEEAGDRQGIVQAGLRLAFSYLALEKGEDVLHWAERIQGSLEGDDSPELAATVQYLMGSGKSYMPRALTEADEHYAAATRLAGEHRLASEIAIQSWFGWGNLSLRRGDFELARKKFQETMKLARSTGDIYFEALSYNNQAYAALLAGDLLDARTTIEAGIDFVMRNELMRPRQYLYSTRGEIALAAGELDEAEMSLTVAHEEARVYDNFTHAANIRANLGRVALARGEHALAQTRLLDAYAAVPDAGASHLRIQIELWLARLYLAGEDISAARRYLEAAQITLADSGRAALQAEADALAEALAVRMAEA